MTVKELIDRLQKLLDDPTSGVTGDTRLNYGTESEGMSWSVNSVVATPPNGRPVTIELSDYTQEQAEQWMRDLYPDKRD